MTMLTATLALLTYTSAATATSFSNSISGLDLQHPFVGEPAAADFKCDLPPVVNPAGDGLPSADNLFSSDEALEKQVLRHGAIVKVPSICYDDLGDLDKDKRWLPFYDLHDVLLKTYPLV